MNRYSKMVAVMLVIFVGQSLNAAATAALAKAKEIVARYPRVLNQRTYNIASGAYIVVRTLTDVVRIAKHVVRPRPSRLQEVSTSIAGYVHKKPTRADDGKRGEGETGSGESGAGETVGGAATGGSETRAPYTMELQTFTFDGDLTSGHAVELLQAIKAQANIQEAYKAAVKAVKYSGRPLPKKPGHDASRAGSDADAKDYAAVMAAQTAQCDSDTAKLNELLQSLQRAS